MKISSITKKIFSGGAQAPFFMNKFLTSLKSQTKAISTLNSLLESGKVPHALLFKGSEGIGKEYTAIQFAKALADYFCEEERKESVIKNIEKLNEPFIKYVCALPRGRNELESHGPLEKLSEGELELIQSEMIKKSSNPFYRIQIPKANAIKINSIRDINRFLSASFDELSYRVILISDAHLMNDPSQNALLKSLEEPPAKVVFILCTAYPERLRTTIRSRCWTINFNPLSDSELIQILSEHFSVDENLAKRVSPFASGSVTSALELIENDFDDLRERTIRVLRYSFGKRFHSALSELSEISENQDQTQLKLLIKMIIIWLNDIHRYRVGFEAYFFSDHIETLQKFNSKYHYLELNGVTERIDNISNSLKNNINLNLAIGNLVTELSSIIP